MATSVFREHVENAFCFLVADYGFTIEPSSHPELSESVNSGERLVFVSKNVRLEMSHSPRGEIALTVDENPPSYRFGFDLYLHAFYPEALRTLGSGIAYSNESVRKQITNIAFLLQRYGRPIVNHDSEVFNRMRTYKWWECRKP